MISLLNEKKVLVLAPTVAIIALVGVSKTQETAKKKAYFFYSESCPHCHKVDQYFKEHNFYEKYEIKKLEVGSNHVNAKLLLDFGEKFNDPIKGAVPTIVFADRHLVGDTPIIENFEKEINSTEVADFPDPKSINLNGINQDYNNYGLGSESFRKWIYWLIVFVIILIVFGYIVFDRLDQKSKLN